MTITKYQGNLLDSKADVIAHQTNCKGAFKSGVAAAIRQRYPVVADAHKTYCGDNIIKGYDSSNLLGSIQPVQVSASQYIVNMFAQNNYGYDGRRYTSYDAMDSCLDRLMKFCLDNNKKSIAIPRLMGCCRGGADWDIIKIMVVKKCQAADINLEVWEYEETSKQ